MNICICIWRNMACVSKLKIICTLCLENESSKGKVLQNVAAFLKVMEKKILKKKSSELHKISQKLKSPGFFSVDFSPLKQHRVLKYLH